MSFGGFGGFGEEESQDFTATAAKTPNVCDMTYSTTILTQKSNVAGVPVGDKRIRSVPISLRTALDAALSAKDAVDLPIVYDVPVKYVEVLGQIETVNYDSSSLMCVVDDGTARLPLKQYFEQPVDVESDTNPFAQFTQGAFVFAVGMLRTGNDPYVSINQIKVVTSANEIAYHILSSCAAHIDIVEEKDGSFGGSTSIRSFGYGHAQAGGMGVSFDSAHSSVTPMKTGNQPGGVTAPSTAALSSAQVEEQVYQFIVSGKATQWGFSKADCALKMKNLGVSESDVNKAIESLLDDARIYDTGDEVHFKAIE